MTDTYIRTITTTIGMNSVKDTVSHSTVTDVLVSNGLRTVVKFDTDNPDLLSVLPDHFPKHDELVRFAAGYTKTKVNIKTESI